MNIFVFANCQGAVFETLLPQIVDRPLNVVRFENFEAIAGKHTSEEIHRFARKADVFIYQPLKYDGEKRWISTSDGEGELGSAVPTGALRVAFPYIYNGALWPMFEENGKVRNSEAITDILDGGASKGDVIELYQKDLIDFRYDRRLSETYSVLEGKERITEIKVMDVMKRYLHDRPIMTTQNHPCTVLVVSMLAQFLSLAEWESDRATAQLQQWLRGDDDNIAQLPQRWLMHSTAAAHLGLAYASGSEPGADEHYLQMIVKICDNYATGSHPVKAAISERAV